MRRITHRTRALRDERGAVAVITALCMVLVIGCAAITIDVGALYAERAQLQGGADAAALAIAQDCAAGSCGSPGATAQTMANANANDAAANIVSVVTGPGTVTVTTSTRESSGSGSLAHVFAPVLGFDSRTVSASSTASWGSPATGPAGLALAFAPCVFKLDGPTQVISMHGDSGGVSCSSVSPSGQVLPGGFGWLQDPAGTCAAKVSVSNPAPVTSSTGVSLPPGCEQALTKLAGQTVLLPVYQDTGGSGSGGWYDIRGWAAFAVMGWNFPGTSLNNNTYTGAKCVGSCKGLIGRFIKFVSLDTEFTYGGANLGASLVRLTG